MYDVITVGSATVDVFAHTNKSELITIKSANGSEEFLAYASGSKMIINELAFTIGGGGTNTATALKRLGLKTGFLGELGKDEQGDQIITFLKKEGIDFLGNRGKQMTGYSIILDSIAHDRTILTYKGCNDCMTFSSLKTPKLKTQWYYFASMMGSSLAMLNQLAAFAKKKKAGICFNPSSYLVSLGIAKLRKLLSHTDILVLNKEEATLLLSSASQPTATMEDLLNGLHFFVPLAVVTDGKQGAWAVDDNHYYQAKTHPIKVIESTGAGDAFASTFLAARMRKKSLEDSLRLALTNAESVISHHGAKNTLLAWAALLKELKKKPVKVNKKKRP